MNNNGFNYSCGTTLSEVFFWLKIPPEREMRIVRELFDEGYAVRGICYAAAKAEDKLGEFIGDSRWELQRRKGKSYKE